MSIAEKTIIEPGAVESRRPIQKATVWWLLGGASVAFLAAYYVPKMLTQKGAVEPKEQVEAPRQTGTEKAIELEMATAAKKPESAQPEPKQDPLPSASSNAPQTAPAPTPLPSTSSSAATAHSDIRPAPTQTDRKRGNVPDIDEIEVQARMSKAVVTDASEARAVANTANGSGDLAEVERRMSAANLAPDRQVNAEPQRGSGQAELLAQLAKAQSMAAGGSRQSDAQWLKDYSEIKPAKAIEPTLVANPFTLVQGKVIPAVLGKALNSDLPGDITAFTTIDVYDSLKGNSLLIPKGSQLVGEYSNQIRDGQGRLMLAFSRIVLPNGLSYALPSAKGQDISGMSGIAGSVDNHYFKRFTSGLLIALFADRLERNNTQPVTNINSSGPSSAAGQVLSELAKADLNKNMGIPPTITVREGTRINVQVVADMEFPGAYKGL